jgi:hypothetical protein
MPSVAVTLLEGALVPENAEAWDGTAVPLRRKIADGLELESLIKRKEKKLQLQLLPVIFKLFSSSSADIPRSCQSCLPGHRKWTVAPQPSGKGDTPVRKTTTWLMLSAFGRSNTKRFWSTAGRDVRSVAGAERCSSNYLAGGLSG